METFPSPPPSEQQQQQQRRNFSRRKNPLLLLPSEAEEYAWEGKGRFRTLPATEKKKERISEKPNMLGSFRHFRFKPPSVTSRRHKKRFAISLTPSGEKSKAFQLSLSSLTLFFLQSASCYFRLPPSAPPSISLVLKRLPPFPPTPPFPFPPSFFLRRKKPPFALIFSAPKKRYPTPYIRRPPPGLLASGRKTVVCLSTCTYKRMNGARQKNVPMGGKRRKGNCRGNRPSFLSLLRGNEDLTISIMSWV